MGFLLLILVLVGAAALVVVVLVRGGRAVRLTCAALLGVLVLLGLVLGLLVRPTVRSPEMATGLILRANPNVIMSTVVDGEVYQDVSEFQVAGSPTVGDPAGDHRYDGVTNIPQELEQADAASQLPAVEANGAARPPGAPAGAEPWVQALGEQNAAQDPHTATKSLAKFMADRVEASVQKVSGGGVRRIASEPGVPREVVDAVSHQMHATNEPPPEGLAGDETVVRLKWDGRTERRMTWWPTPMLKGTLEAHVAGPKGTAVVTAKLDEKPWLHQQDGPHRGGPYAVVISEMPEATAAEALGAVKRSASAVLYGRVQAELMGMSNGRSVPHQVIRQQALWAAQSNRGVLDECVIRVERLYGPVYYAAQLRDVRPGVLQPIASASIAATREARQTFTGMIAGLGGMVLVLGVLYLGLNALTRGYFRGRLLAGSVVAALVGGAVLLVLIA